MDGMGQAKVRKSRLQRVLAEQPWCIYCGGTTVGASLDHMPPIGLFDERQRPGDGMVYVACNDCHDGTHGMDAVAGVLCRIFPDPNTPANEAEVVKLFQGIANNAPGILNEWNPSDQQLELANQVGGPFAGNDNGALNIGPKTHFLMLAFAARALFALHFESCRQIVPSTGAAVVRWYTNESYSTGDFPSDLAKQLPAARSLQQGKKVQVGRFEFSSIPSPDNRFSVHHVKLRMSFAFEGVVAYDLKDIQDLRPGELLPRAPELLFRPGFLKGL